MVSTEEFKKLFDFALDNLKSGTEWKELIRKLANETRDPVRA